MRLCHSWECSEHLAVTDHLSLQPSEGPEQSWGSRQHPLLPARPAPPTPVS